MLALDAARGRLLWTFRSAVAFESSPAADEAAVYVGADDGQVYALAARDGHALWQYRAAGLVRSAPVLADGLLFFGSDDSYLYALDAGQARRPGVTALLAPSPPDRPWPAVSCMSARPTAACTRSLWGAGDACLTLSSLGRPYGRPA